jgi:hypothetical protein
MGWNSAVDRRRGSQHALDMSMITGLDCRMEFPQQRINVILHVSASPSKSNRKIGEVQLITFGCLLVF